MFISVSSGTFFGERLNAVSRMRFTNINWSSNAELAIDKIRGFPSELFLGGSATFPSAACPGARSNCAGFSRWKVTVRSPASTSAEQNGFATGDRNFFASHAHVFESHVGQVPNHESILRAKISGRKTMEAKSVRRADAFDRSKANRAA